MRKRLGIFWFGVAVMAYGRASAETPACTLRHATYRYAYKGALTLTFIPVKRHWGRVSDLVLQIAGVHGRDVRWYSPDEGSSPTIFLISTIDPRTPGWNPNPDGGDRPHGDTSILLLDSEGHSPGTAPQLDSPATRYIVIPDMAAAYKEPGMDIGPAAFVLTSCR